MQKHFIKRPGAHVQVPNNGKILFTIENGDEEDILPLAKRFAQIGYQVFTTRKQHHTLRITEFTSIKKHPISMNSTAS